MLFNSKQERTVKKFIVKLEVEEKKRRNRFLFVVVYNIIYSILPAAISTGIIDNFNSNL